MEIVVPAQKRERVFAPDVAGIHVLDPQQSKEGGGGRNKSGHDERVVLSKHIM
jgi:hypothetical protein